MKFQRIKLFFFGFVLLISNPVMGKSLGYLLMDVQMTLNRDTSIDVVERCDVVFNGDWNGLYRDYLLHGCDGIEVEGVLKMGMNTGGGVFLRKGDILLRQRSRRFLSSGEAEIQLILPINISLPPLRFIINLLVP